ncbi:hypothetical protein [Sphingopyxis indica]|uniref:Uncharacterized protein n=1 Tax=Sphingopyxis indica TaxID=436663 RepID=A0A239HVS4_9SPHN|nr:hypothetical protein [Sphingopyxis indica]SNS84793.1 hypothetical protein SAMN06295955_106123 [Sphingopyxis indica]
MGMLNNWDIGGGVSDFWDYVRQPRPHRWTSWGVAIAIAILLFWGFGKYLIPYEKPKPQIIYFENWKADRSEADIRADWIARARETTRENARRRAEFQKLADMMGVDYDSREADRVTRETLGKEADTLDEKPAPPKRSTLAERAARTPPPPADEAPRR